MTTVPRPVRGILTTSIVALALFLGTQTAHATHGRYLHLSWTPGSGTNEILFTFVGGFRRNGYSGTAPDGFPAVGDIINEGIGGTSLDFGDGNSTGQLQFLVTSIDPTNNWLQGTALDPAGGAGDTNINHTYSATGNVTAFSESCCRISSVAPPNEHINNPDGEYRVETVVNVGTGNSSPQATLPPIVACPINGLCEFTVPAADPNGNPMTFRLSTAAEAGDASFVQPGLPQAPNAATIDPITGLYSWDTTGATLAADPNNTTLYSTQVTIEDGNSKSAVDFLISLVTFVGSPPVFDSPPTPACGSTIPANVGGALNFTVQGSDSDTGQTVTLNVAGLPPGASMNPALPTNGNPVSSDFSWEPAETDVGSHVVTFTVVDNLGLQALCSFTIEVTQAGLDHFLFYRDRGTPTISTRTVTLSDRFETRKYMVEEAWAPRLGTPADKNEEGIFDPDTHLWSYLITGPHAKQTGIKVSNQFHPEGNELIVDTVRAERLLVPTAKSLTGPVDPPDLSLINVDHYKCYRVRLPHGTPKFPKGLQATVADQFNEATVYNLTKPLWLCTPVDKDDEGIKNPDANLMCYEVARAKGQPRNKPVTGVHVSNQFGAAELNVIEASDLCVPSTITVGGD